jgi:hypothetical protein
VENVEPPLIFVDEAKVGLFTALSGTPNPTQIPLVNSVLPQPSSPIKAMTLPASSFSPSRLPKLKVLAGLLLRKENSCRMPVEPDIALEKEITCFLTVVYHNDIYSSVGSKLRKS